MIKKSSIRKKVYYTGSIIISFILLLFYLTTSIIITKTPVNLSLLSILVVTWLIGIFTLKIATDILFKPINELIENLDKFNNQKNFEIEESLRKNPDIEITKLVNNYENIVEQFFGTLEELKASNELLFSSYKEIEDSYYYFTDRMTHIIEGYDKDTGNHIERVGKLSEYIAQKLGLSERLIEEIRKYAPLHDIGKIVIPQSILLKNGFLTQDEFNIMKTHTVEGAKILSGNLVFQTAKNIALYHHEKYRGNGYPHGLSGEEIPIEAAIVSLVDVYDALRSKRLYKPAYEHEKAYEVITCGDGRTSPEDFNPAILEIFKKFSDEIEELWNKTNDIEYIKKQRVI